MPSENEPRDIKAAMRKALRARRDTLEASERRQQANAIAGHLVAGLREGVVIAPGAIVTSYRPMGAECDTGPSEDALRRHGHRIALPVTPAKGQPLSFRLWQPGQRLITHGFGMREPDPALPPVRPDVLLVPLLGFDGRGNRLGYGGGYYDRTLAFLRAAGPVMAVGIGFREQEVDAVPVQGYDERLDAILTADGIRHCRYSE